MTAVNSQFTVNGSLPTDAVAVAAGSTVTLQILNTTGINGVVWSVAGNDNSARVNPVIAATGNVGATATFVMPADVGDGLGQSYRIQCRASDDGSNTSTTSAIVGVVNRSAVVPIAAGEELDRNLTYGWTMPFNSALAGPATVSHGAMQPADGIHGFVSELGPYSTSTLRQAGPFTSAQINKVARQTDTDPNTLWYIDKVVSGVATWRQFVTAADGFGGDFGSITPSCVGYWRGDLGLGLTSTTVNSWANQIAAGAGIAGNAIEVSSTVGMGITDAGIGGRAAISSNGTTHGGKYAYVGPTPATTNFHIYCVYQAANKGSSQVITGTAANELLLWEPGGAGNVGIYDANQLNTTRTANTWARFRASFTGATSGTNDKVKWGSTAEASGFAGNGISTTTNRGIFSDEAGGQKLQGKIALMLLSTAAEATWVAALPALDAAVTSWFGAGNVLV